MKSGQLGTITQNGMFAGGMSPTPATSSLPFASITGNASDNSSLVTYVGAQSIANGNITKLTQPIATVSTSTTLTNSQYTIIADATAGALIETLPVAATSVGKILIVKKKDVSANTVTVKGNGAELIDGANTVVLSAQYASVTVHCDGTQWWVI